MKHAQPQVALICFPSKNYSRYARATPALYARETLPTWEWKHGCMRICFPSKNYARYARATPALRPRYARATSALRCALRWDFKLEAPQYRFHVVSLVASMLKNIK